MVTKIEKIRAVLQDSVHPTIKPKNFFKTGIGEYAEHDIFMGIKVPVLRTIAKAYPDLSRDELKSLLHSKINEERLLALIILVAQYKTGTKEEQEVIYQLYITNLSHVNNWNLVDSSAHLILGAHLWNKDKTLLLTLAQSKNLWDRRIAIIATWYFIKKDDLTWTFTIAQLLLHDSQDLIHKAVGWMLREAGKKDEDRLISFLCDHVHQMHKTMLRYAMEKLSKEQQAILARSAVSG